MTKGVNERIEEYVNYHNTGDADCYGKLLKKYVDNEGMSDKDIFDLIYFYSITYNIPSAIVLYKERDKIRQDTIEYAKSNKEKLLFQSDRKYVRIGDRFEKCLTYWKDKINFEDFKEKTMKGNKIKLQVALRYVQNWFYFGRFASFLFIEGICSTMGCFIENCSIKWQEGDTATSGIMNVFGYDKYADYFDKYNKIAKGLNVSMLDNMLDLLKREIERKGGNNNATYIETSLCAYRKFYKGTRYNGFYLDRQLEEIRYIEGNYPKYKEEINKLKLYRQQLFDKKYLGELNGWNGIRKECKKSYLIKGEIM